ncbi:MAG: tRNA (guanosine(37)-N1)-methyltransferase TrmD [Candidatus Omnitrophica bacterium]|nr:tRNA (guanosine(37)-N1)-methyltransferase TrmD [Candidatus Omnitrophota bacterium]
MKIDIITLFPGMFSGPFDESIIKRAKQKGLVDVCIHDLRKWTDDLHRTVDDKPYGGGPGMVMKVEPVDRALSEIRPGPGSYTEVILITPQGNRFDQSTARDLSGKDRLIFICGHYEGFDERIRSLVDSEISIGDFVLTCGELPAMVICDSVIRLLPGVLGDEACLEHESFEHGLLEYPQYTRPADYKGMKVPGVLLCGDPKKISAWQEQMSLERTKERRPDLLKHRK